MPIFHLEDDVRPLNEEDMGGELIILIQMDQKEEQGCFFCFFFGCFLMICFFIDF